MRKSAFTWSVMTRFPLVSLLFTAGAALGTGELVAEETGPLAKETNPAEKPTPAPAKPRLISAETAEILAGAAPKYVAPSSNDPARQPDVDLRETDKPRN